jgi:hypothetical protein
VPAHTLREDCLIMTSGERTARTFIPVVHVEARGCRPRGDPLARRNPGPILAGHSQIIQSPITV